MIRVEIRPRQDDKYDMYVGDEGDHFANSDQGYENVEDVIEIARRLWPPLPTFGDIHTAAWGTEVRVPSELVAGVLEAVTRASEPVVMRVNYRNGKTHTERLR